MHDNAALLCKRSLGRIADPAATDTSNRYVFNDLFSAAWLSEAVGVAVALKLPDAIQESPVSVAQIAEKQALHAESLYRLLRALASNGIFEEHTGKAFGHTSLSRQLRNDHPYSYRPMAALWTHERVRKSWGSLSESIRNGHSGIQNATGKTLYETLMADAEAAAVFNGAMVSNSGHASETIARSIDFSGYHSVMDLAGGVGTLLGAILKAHPHLHGILYELPYLEEPSKAYFKQHAIMAEFASGDFTQRVPGGVDVYLVKNTLWNFRDPDALAVLKNVRAAMQGRRCELFIIEYMIQPENAPWTALFDLQMLNLPGGRARTVLEYKELLAQAKFSMAPAFTIEDQTVIKALPA